MDAITDTFVLVAADCPVAAAEVPTTRGTAVTVPALQYELLAVDPYTLTLEDLIFATHVHRAGLSAAEVGARGAAIRAELFAKSHPCMRASALPKRYGWGVHHDGRGHIALYPVEGDDYRRFAAGMVPGVAVVPAMRNKRAGW